MSRCIICGKSKTIGKYCQECTEGLNEEADTLLSDKTCSQCGMGASSSNCPTWVCRLCGKADLWHCGYVPRYCLECTPKGVCRFCEKDLPTQEEQRRFYIDNSY